MPSVFTDTRDLAYEIFRRTRCFTPPKGLSVRLVTNTRAAAAAAAVGRPHRVGCCCCGTVARWKGRWCRRRRRMRRRWMSFGICDSSDTEVSESTVLSADADGRRGVFKTPNWKRREKSPYVSSCVGLQEKRGREKKKLRLRLSDIPKPQGPVPCWV